MSEYNEKSRQLSEPTQTDGRKTSTVEDVIIPTYLLQVVSKNDSHAWKPQAAPQLFWSSSSPHVPQLLPHQPRNVADETYPTRRTASVALPSSRWSGINSSSNHFPGIEEGSGESALSYKKHSLPIIGEDLSSKHNDSQATVVHPGSLINTDAGGTTVFGGLQDFSFQARRRKSVVPATAHEQTEDPISSPSTRVPLPRGFSYGRTYDGKSYDGRTHEERPQRDSAHLPVPIPLQPTVSRVRRSSMWVMYEEAKARGEHLQRQPWAQILFEYSIYTVLALFIYFVLVGLPLWKGAVYWLWWVVDHKFTFAGGFSITVGLGAIYAFAPLLIFFEDDPPASAEQSEKTPEKQYVLARDTALLIPCYKSAGIIAHTLEAALKIFPASHIFVLANGNSPAPLDNTEEICTRFGVNHVWSSIGSKIVAQFVGCYAAKSFTNVLLIDDDCALPPNFPIVADRMKGKVKCIGYTIKSVGPDSSKGTLCQQAQDLEYKMSGLQRAFAGKLGSATFPHGAISLWNRAFLLQTFHEHPGFTVSEDWFFGHVARKLGCRIQMCTSTFVETETPAAVFWAEKGGARGGFGEMTIFKQRFLRWNFFYVNGMWYNISYILGSWKLGWWEIGTKIFVFQEVYETLLYLVTPFIIPISLIVRPAFFAYLLAGMIFLYLANVIIFNEVHLRRKRERVGSVTVYLYYMPYKIVLTVVNVVSCYWSMWKYAQYFAKRHPKVTEDERAVDIVMKLEEQVSEAGAEEKQDGAARVGGRPGLGGRRITARTISSRVVPGAIV